MPILFFAICLAVEKNPHKPNFSFLNSLEVTENLVRIEGGGELSLECMFVYRSCTFVVVGYSCIELLFGFDRISCINM